MSNQAVISYADLSFIEDSLRSIGSELSEVNSVLEVLNVKQEHMSSELVKLADAFAGFIASDLRQKALQLAETRLGNLKQDLQIKFGYYAEIRRMATGILQGVDTGVVSDDILKFTTEEVLIKASGYWLAPALVALTAWVRNDKSTHEKALNEALRRDDYKTTLFFMLVMRRLARNEASLRWLERYFMHQNPRDLNREFIIILESVAKGVFPPAARKLMMSNVKKWLDQLTQSDNFINQQKSHWIKSFEAMSPLLDRKYPLLEKFSTNWNILENSLKKAKTHDVLYSHFKGIISTSTDFSKEVKVQLDEILYKLVTNFDDEELPLQEQVRLNELIIQMDGDKSAAQSIMGAEKRSFEEKLDFLQLLTNASFNPEISGATKVTQALAVSICQPWIVEAYDTFAGQIRNQVPQIVELSIDDFETSTKDGSDEDNLVSKLEAFYQDVLQKELKGLPFPYSGVITGALACLAGVWALSLESDFGFLSFGFIWFIGVFLIWYKTNAFNKAKENINGNIEKRRRKAKEILRGCINEIVDYRKEYKTEDSKAEKVRQLLTSITPEDFSSISKETARNII